MARIAYKAYETGIAAGNSSVSRFSEHETIALHNIKRLVESIGLKLEKTVKLEQEEAKGNKLNAVTDRITNDPRGSARNILSATKSSSQIEFEFDAIDKAKNQTRPDHTSYTTQRIHTLAVMSAYLFEEELSEKHISVSIQEYYGRFQADFGSARSAVSQIFSNAVKYSKERSTIYIKFIEDDRMINMEFKMISRFFKNDEASQFTLFKVRGVNAEGTDGDGIGLYSAALMMKFNNGYIRISSDEESKAVYAGLEYSTNTFTLGFLKA